MEVLVKRIAKKEKYTIGKVYVDGVYICDCIEDKDRGLRNDMTLAEIQKKKVMHETAIPTGTYRLTMNVVSPRFAKKNLPVFRPYGHKIPRILDVKGFDGILIHNGSTERSSSGCIILGENKEVGRVLNSEACCVKFIEALRKAKDTIMITIK